MRTALVLLGITIATAVFAQEAQQPPAQAPTPTPALTPTPDLEARIAAEEAANGFHCATILREEGEIKPPELPPTLATEAAKHAARLKTLKAARRAWERAFRKDVQKEWEAALAYEYLDPSKPALNPGLIFVAQAETGLTPTQCSELLPYLRRALRYKLCQDRVGTPDHEIRDWKFFNTPHWGNTHGAICGCCETEAAGSGGLSERCQRECPQLMWPAPVPQPAPESK